jgi:hypothetical protein
MVQARKEKARPDPCLSAGGIGSLIATGVPFARQLRPEHGSEKRGCCKRANYERHTFGWWVATETFHAIGRRGSALAPQP